MAKIRKRDKLLEFPNTSPRAVEYESDIEKLNSIITTQMENADNERWTRAISWFTNASFLSGNHWDSWRWNGRSLSNDGEQLLHNRWRNLFTPKQSNNAILRAVEHNVSTLTSMNPTAKIEPATDHPEDESDARVASRLIDVLWEEPLRIPQKLRDMVRYLCICGSAAIELRYTQLEVPEEVEKTQTETVELDDGTTEEVEVPTGDFVWRWRQGLQSKVWSAFHINVNPDATDDYDTVSWICVSSYEDPTYIRRRYNRSDPGFRPEGLKNMAIVGEEASTPLWYWEEMKDLLDSASGSGVTRIFTTEGHDEQRPRVLVRRIYTRPNADKFPMGRLIVQAGGEIIYSGPSDVWTEERPERWHPFSLFRFWTMPGRFFGKPLISELTGLQRRVNAIDAIMEVNRAYLGVGSMMIPSTCKVPEGYAGPLPGQVLTYRPDPRGLRPERINYQPLPGDILNERTLVLAEMDQISGINTAPQLGPAPSAVRSESMVRFYQQSAMASKSAMMLDYEASIQQLIEDILRLADRHLRDDRDILRRLSASARGESIAAVKRFQDHALSDNVHVSIDIQAQAQQSPEAKRQSALELMQFSGGNLSMAQVAKLAKVMGLDELEMESTPMFERARMVVEQVMAGNIEWAEPMRMDNPDIFISVLEEVMAQPRYLESDPEIIRTLDSLYTHYTQQAQARAQAQAPAMAAAQAQETQ